MKRSIVLVATAAGVALGLGTLSFACGSVPDPVTDDARVANIDSDAPEGGFPDTREPSDSGRDSSMQGEWASIPSLPANCPLRLSTTPTLAIPRLPWKPCVSGQAGCLLFLQDWGKMDGLSFRINHYAPPYEDESGVHFSYYRELTETAQWISIVQALHGDAELVLAGTTGERACFAAKVHSSVDGLGLTITQDAPKGAGQPEYQTWAAWAAHGLPTRLEVEPLTAKIGSAPIVQGLVRGDGLLAFEHTAGGPVFSNALNLTTRTVRAHDGGVPASTMATPAAGGFFVVTSGQAQVVAFFPETGDMRTIIRPLAGYSVQIVNLDRARANELVWTEHDELRNDTILYSSPFSTTEAGIVRRAVARLPENTFGQANAGLFVHGLTAQSARIVRLSDGRSWPIDGGAGGVGAPLVSAVWVNDDFAWLTISGIGENEPGYPVFGGLARISRPKNEPPIPNGL